MNYVPMVWQVFFGLFCVAIAVQLFYYLVFFRRLAWFEPAERKDTQEYAVSVIVCARDEAENLVKNLPGVLVQSYRTTHEVIVVNDNSVDDSKHILDQFRKSFKNLVAVPLVQEAKGIPGKKFPLSMGIRTARYEILLLTDADCVPVSEHWIMKMQQAYKPGIEIVLGYGTFHKRPGLLNKVIRFETFHTAFQYLSFALAGRPYMGVGRNLSYKKDLFLSNKGFSAINQVPSGDDDLFINKVATKSNTAIMIDPESFTLSEAKSTWGQWWSQKYRHYSTARFYKGADKRMLGMYTASQVLLFPFLALAMVFNWWIPLILFAVRWIVQGVIFSRSMKKLGEQDLLPLYPLFDIWTFIYYVLIVPALWKKPRKTWN